MAKKQYLSPEVEVSTLSCEDVLTSSGDIQVNPNGYNNHVVGSFQSGWFGNN